MSLITALITFALLHTQVSAYTEIKLGCLSAVPTNTAIQTKSSTLAECNVCPFAGCLLTYQAMLIVSQAFCAGEPASYAYYAANGSCSCSDIPAENTLYVRGADMQANCTDESVWVSLFTHSHWSLTYCAVSHVVFEITIYDGELILQYTGLINSTTNTSDLTTTCPSLGPKSLAQMKGYRYISILPSPLNCYTTCTDLYPDSSVTLIQPGMGGVACACAEEMSGEGYTDVCGAQSWYAVRSGGIGSGVGELGGSGSRRKRAVRRLV